MIFHCNPDNPRSCLCCGRRLAKRDQKSIRDREEANAAIESLIDLGYTKEDMLGLFRPHLDWQAPGLAAFVRQSLN